MTNELEAALHGVFLEAPPGTLDERVCRALVEDCVSLGCGNLIAKLVKEGKKRRASGGLEDLMAELRVARALARHLGPNVVKFDVGDAPDLRFVAGGVDCLVEVKHEPAPSPWSELFHPDPVDVPGMADANDRNAWKQAGHRFHTVLASLPIAVQPWLGEDFLKERYGYKARAEQEAACAEVASWLAENLPPAVESGLVELRHPTLTATFDLKPLDQPPGQMLGSGSLEAWFVDEGVMRAAIRKKAEKAAERLEAAAADCYLVALVAAEAIASLGHFLQTTLLGPLVHRGGPNGGRSFRSVPDAFRPQVDAALRAGRGDLLELALYDVRERGSYGENGLFFEADLAPVAGVLGLYYTEDLQFVPNAFSSSEIQPLRRLFPTQLSPFAVR